MEISTEAIKILATVLALMIAIIGHEIMHGYVAYRYGDDTARLAGRLSINPIVHVDLVGTIILPALLYVTGAPFLFGWAKPVPVSIRTVIQNGGYKGAIGVALAGISYNFILAIICAISLQYIGKAEGIFELFFILFLVQSMVYNVVLGVFNLYPIPPLDGSHALEYFAVWNRWYKLANALQSMERYGMIILLLLIATPASQYFFAPIRYILNAIAP